MISLTPGLRMAAERPVHSRSCDIYAWDDRGTFHVVTIERKESESQAATINPFIQISFEEGQLLFNALHGAGYRVQGDTDDSKEVAAINAHVDSLRDIGSFQCDIIMRLLAQSDAVVLSEWDIVDGTDGDMG